MAGMVTKAAVDQRINLALCEFVQSGRLDAYLLYMLIALIAIIAVVTALA